MAAAWRVPATGTRGKQHGRLESTGTPPLRHAEVALGSARTVPALFLSPLTTPHASRSSSHPCPRPARNTLHRMSHSLPCPHLTQTPERCPCPRAAFPTRCAPSQCMTHLWPSHSSACLGHLRLQTTCLPGTAHPP